MPIMSAETLRLLSAGQWIIERATRRPHQVGGFSYPYSPDRTRFCVSTKPMVHVNDVVPVTKKSWDNGAFKAAFYQISHGTIQFAKNMEVWTIPTLDVDGVITYGRLERCPDVAQAIAESEHVKYMKNRYGITLTLSMKSQVTLEKTSKTAVSVAV